MLQQEPDWRRPINLKLITAAIFKTAPANVMRWWKDRDKLRGLWSARRKSGNKGRGARSLKVMRRLPRVQTSKFHKAECKLYSEFREKRKAGYKVGGLWLRLRFVALVKELHHGTVVKGSKGWLFGWTARFSVRARKRTAYKMPVKDRLPKIRRWHHRFISRLKRGKQICPTYGRWPLKNRFNSDQVLAFPCVFLALVA